MISSSRRAFAPVIRFHVITGFGSPVALHSMSTSVPSATLASLGFCVQATGAASIVSLSRHRIHRTTALDDSHLTESLAD